MIGFNEGYGHRTTIEQLDRRTWRPVAGRSVTLPDAGTQLVIGPTGDVAAIGGVNRGLYLLDLRRVGRSGAITHIATSKPRDYATTVPVAWPSPHRLVVLVTSFEPHRASPSRLEIVDPARRRVVSQTSLHRSVIHATADRRGDLTLLLGPRNTDRIGAPRLLEINAAGRRDSVTLPHVRAGFNDTGLPHHSADVEPGLAMTDDTVYVAAGNKIVSSPVGRLEPTTYHVRRLMTPSFHAQSAPASGSAGALAEHDRTLHLVAGRLVVSGRDIAVTDHGDRLRTTIRMTQIVDVRAWRVQSTLRRLQYPSLQGRDIVGSRPDHGDGPGGLTAYRPDGRRLFSRHLPAGRGFWSSDGRLAEYPLDLDRGGPITKLDPTTGRPTRTVHPGSGYPFNLFTWTPGHQQTAAALPGSTDQFS